MCVFTWPELCCAWAPFIVDAFDATHSGAPWRDSNVLVSRPPTGTGVRTALSFWDSSDHGTLLRTVDHLRQLLDGDESNSGEVSRKVREEAERRPDAGGRTHANENKTRARERRLDAQRRS